MLESRLLEILVCPVSGGKLFYKKDRQELWCRESGLAYPVRDSVPIMLEAEARKVDEDEWKAEPTE